MTGVHHGELKLAALAPTTSTPCFHLYSPPPPPALLSLSLKAPYRYAFTWRAYFLTKLAHSLLSHPCLSCPPGSFICPDYRPTSSDIPAVFSLGLSVITGLSPICNFLGSTGDLARWPCAVTRVVWRWDPGGWEYCWAVASVPTLFFFFFFAFPSSGVHHFWVRFLRMWPFFFFFFFKSNH